MVGSLIRSVFGPMTKEQDRQQHTALRALCDELGLNVVKRRWYQCACVMGEVNGWYVSVQYLLAHGGGYLENRHLTVFSAYYAQPTDFRFNIQYRHFQLGEGLNWLDRRARVQTESPEIDFNYISKTNDELKFRLLLEHQSWCHLFGSGAPVQLVSGAHNGLSSPTRLAPTAPSTGMGHSHLYYNVGKFVYDRQRLKSIIESLVDTLDHMQKIGVAEKAYGSWLEHNILEPIEKGKDRQ